MNSDKYAMNSYKYGYLWWLYEEDGIFAYSVMGDGVNVICCVPEKDLMIEIASKIITNPRDKWQLIKKFILPSISQNVGKI